MIGGFHSPTCSLSQHLPPSYTILGGCVCGGGGGGGVIVYSQPRVGGGIMTVHLLVPPSHTHTHTTHKYKST